MDSNARINSIFAALAAQNSSPETELYYVNHYTLLVAVVLSAQSTDAGVNKATRPLFSHVQTPQQMLALGEAGLRDAIKTIGLYKNKAKHVIGLSRMLVEEYRSEVPDDRDALMRLPGVGRKTANVVLNCAFGQPTMPVDTHVFRVAHRLGLAHGKTPEAVEKELVSAIPSRWMTHAHHWLILHGRYICKARKPACDRCPVAEYCPSVQR